MNSIYHGIIFRTEKSHDKIENRTRWQVEDYRVMQGREAQMEECRNALKILTYNLTGLVVDGRTIIIMDLKGICITRNSIYSAQDREY